MIETLERNHLNIKDLIIPESFARVKPFFDPADYLSPLDISKAEFLARRTNDVEKWSRDMFNLKVCAPEVFETAIADEKGIVENIKYQTKKLNDGERWREAQNSLAWALLALPHRRDDLTGINRKGRKLPGLANSYRQMSWETYFTTSFLAKIVVPDQYHLIVVDQTAKDEVKRITRTDVRGKKAFRLTLAAKARILFPDNIEIWKPDTGDWEVIRNFFDSDPLRRSTNVDDASNFFMSLAAATILGADDIKFSKEKGLELISHTKRSSIETNPIPERRRF